MLSALRPDLLCRAICSRGALVLLCFALLLWLSETTPVTG
jgi:hypothetical protein